MKYQSGKRIEVIAATTPEAFAKEINSKLAQLDAQKAQYELQFNNNMGLCAYIVIDKVTEVPEFVSEEFALIGVRRTCLDCPYWVHPTKGNVKYTRCPITAGVHSAKSPACETYYEMLLNGEIDDREEADE